MIELIKMFMSIVQPNEFYLISERKYNALQNNILYLEKLKKINSSNQTRQSAFSYNGRNENIENG